MRNAPLINILDRFEDFFNFKPGEFIASLLYYIADGINVALEKEISNAITEVSAFASEQITSTGAVVFADGSTISTIHTYIMPVGYSLLALFFIIDFVKRTAYLEVLTLENALKPIMMLVVGKFFIDNSKAVMKKVYDIGSSLSDGIFTITSTKKEIFSKAGEVKGMGLTLPKASGDEAVRETVIAFFGTGIFTVLMIVLMATVVIMAIVLVIRKVEIAMLICVAPLFVSTLMGNVTNDVFKAYIKYYIAVVFQVVIIAIGIVILNSDLINFVTLGSQGAKVDKQLDFVPIMSLLIQGVVICGVTLASKPMLLKWMGR